MNQFCAVQCADSTILLRFFQMHSPDGEQCTSVVCKTFVAFAERKIDDFIKLSLWN